MPAQGLAFKRAGSLCPLFLELLLPANPEAMQWEAQAEKEGHVWEPQSAGPAELPAQSQHQQLALEMTYLRFLNPLMHPDWCIYLCLISHGAEEPSSPSQSTHKIMKYNNMLKKKKKSPKFHSYLLHSAK